VKEKREVLGARVEKSTIEMLRKLAKKKYGKENKVGYVVDEAVKVFFTSDSRPEEASAILSTTEEILISRLDRRMNDIFDQVVNRIGDLYARTSHDSAVSFVMLEDIFLNSGLGTKEDVGKLRGDASRIMQKRLETVGSGEILEQGKQEFKQGMNTDQAASNDTDIYEEVERLRKENEQIKEEANSYYEKWKKKNERLTEENEQLRKDVEYLQGENNRLNHWYGWHDGLMDHMKDNYSRLKSNAALIDEYKASNPAPTANG